LIFLDFFSPELLSAFWPFEQMAIMAVPEAPINENNCLISRKDQVGLSRQFAVVQSKSKAASVETLPDHHFRLGILRADA
jgi:hypothetical protein